MGRQSTLAGRCLGLLVFTQTAVAQAQATTTDPLIRQGLELVQAGRDADALGFFRRSWEATHRPIALGQMGLAEIALGHWVEAEEHVRTALSFSGDDWVSRRRAALEGAYATIVQHVGQLEVSGGPAGAVVFVNGQSVGTLPLRAPIHLEVGTVTLEVRQSGHYAVSRPIEVIAGRVARESVTLRGRSDADGVVSTSSTLRVDTPHSPLGALSWSPPSGALVLSGVGLVAMIAGGVIVGSYLEPSGRCNPCDQGTQQGRDATTAGYAVYGGDVAIAAGGALAAAGVVWLVVSYMTSSPPRRVAIVPMGSMLTATWSF